MLDAFGFVFIHGLAIIGAVTLCRWAEDWTKAYRASRSPQGQDSQGGET